MLVTERLTAHAAAKALTQRKQAITHAMDAKTGRMERIAERTMPKGGWQEFSSADSLQRPSDSAAEPTPKAQQMVRVQPTRGGRGGKTVTVIRGLELDTAGFKALLKKLKSRIGSGGTAKDGVVELQGDQVELVLELLTKEGYRPKRAGG